MSIIDEIEELFKSEDFAKSVNRNALNALFRNTAILRDPNLSAEQKQQAIENIKAITHNLQPKPINISKPKKTKVTKPEKPAEAATETKSIKPVKAAPAAQTTSPAVTETKAKPKTIPTPSSEEHPFPEDFHIHHGVDPIKFKAAWDAMSPEQKKITLDWHKEQLAAKNINKSLDRLYKLFETLKKHI
jgi:hypothetical protein